jgi:hypothetical protein
MKQKRLSCSAADVAAVVKTSGLPSAGTVQFWWMIMKMAHLHVGHWTTDTFLAC